MKPYVTLGVAFLAACHASTERSSPPRDGVPDVVLDEQVPPTERVARLTHLQWENAVRDLLRLPESPGLSSSFLGDPPSAGFENDAAALEVAPELWQDYQWAAEIVAAEVVTDPELYARVRPPALADRDAWIREIGGRAHRRPLRDDEVQRYVELYDAGPELIGSDDESSGVEAVLLALLQSPWFLYRIEEAAVPDASGLVPLSSFELASRLSFALWNTMPDDALFAAAERDELRDVDGLRAEALRLLDDPRAMGVVEDLHRQLLHLDDYANITRDPALFPEFGPTTAASMAAEAQAFVADVLDDDGGVRSLLTTPRAFVNQDLAPIYGVAVTGDALVPVDLDPARRAGLLTLSGFLTLEADDTATNPIGRGVFVNREVLCAHLPGPPDSATPLPPPTDSETTRERVEAHTGDGTCGQGCHSNYINPIGFAYEHFDSLGRYRTEENGHEVITSGTYRFEDGERWFGDAVDLGVLLARAPQVHRCYVGHWLSYLHGRALTPEDAVLLDRLGEASLEDDVPIRDLVLELVLSDAFRNRQTEVAR